MTDKETLKPCPFCGNEAFIESYLARKGYEATIHCTECLAMINTITYDTESEAVEKVTKAWNRRANNETTRNKN